MTPGAEMVGGRSMNDIAHRTGWLSYDIDGKDNLHILDWEAAKQRIGTIVYVAYCGLSASGNGL